MLINKELKFVYFFIPKVACSALKDWYLKSLDLEFEGSVHKVIPNEYIFRPFPEEISSREADEIIMDPEYYKFCFVRNPLSRLTSAYVNKFVRENHFDFTQRQLKKVIKKLNLPGDRQEKGITFRQFVDFLNVSDPAQMDYHWRPMSHMIPVNVQMDHIGKMETFQDDFQMISRKVRFESEVAYKNKTTYGQHHGFYGDTYPEHFDKRSFPEFDKFYDESILNDVLSIYSEDFSRFGYAPAIK